MHAWRPRWKTPMQRGGNWGSESPGDCASKQNWIWGQEFGFGYHCYNLGAKCPPQRTIHWSLKQSEEIGFWGLWPSQRSDILIHSYLYGITVGVLGGGALYLGHVTLAFLLLLITMSWAPSSSSLWAKAPPLHTPAGYTNVAWSWTETSKTGVTISPYITLTSLCHSGLLLFSHAPWTMSSFLDFKPK